MGLPEVVSSGVNFETSSCLRYLWLLLFFFQDGDRACMYQKARCVQQVHLFSPFYPDYVGC